MINTTYTSIQTNAATIGGILPVVTCTVLIAGIIGLTIFVISTRFRKLVYGLIATVPASIILYISSRISVQAVTYQNTTPLKWLAGIVFFLLITILVGYFSEKIPIFQKIEQKLKESTKGEQQ